MFNNHYQHIGILSIKHLKKKNFFFLLPGTPGCRRRVRLGDPGTPGSRTTRVNVERVAVLTYDKKKEVISSYVRIAMIVYPKCRQSLLSLHMTKSYVIICKDSHTFHIKSGSKSNTNSQLQSQFSHRIWTI